MIPVKSLLTGLLLCCSLFAAAADLHLYAGAGLRAPVDEIIARFEKETGHRVTVEYGGSGQILTRVQLTRRGDLFLPGSADYVDKLSAEGLVSAAFPLVLHTPVMAVRKDKAAGITTFAQLAESQLKLGMGDPKAIALGKSGEKLLALTGYGESLREKVVVRTATIKQLVVYLLNGDVDAAVIGRTDAVNNSDTLVILPTPAGTPQEIATLALLQSSQHPEEARLLADYFAAAPAIKVFTDRGYLPVSK
ncbi:molybdate ABC transporter substrate-binding protein [Intestinirhabdus alba]|jgi:molybdate transport system substrate-binding protein|uniref:Molybdate ABC transporter substrate-binding protein n=1 Tax=Intestinirhabdus alba TaxID=2899544 RepID=A0A6L6IKA3_9ENTR|nr:molybdate ABC transporter substrate-binding protein [Intestinirhabdus alba]MTH45143.1 molybdate ABC transporter substrate-binding protein [Intestinirhabdus alba]